jgi:hypothetical protein
MEPMTPFLRHRLVSARPPRLGRARLALVGLMLLGLAFGSGLAAPLAEAHDRRGDIISAGLLHACGIKSDGTLICWGESSFGESTPPPGTFTQVSAGAFHTCGVRSDGTLACWGLNDYGQATPPAGTFTQVSAALSYTCGLRSDGTAVCWGYDAGGPPPPAGTFIQVSAGPGFGCGVKGDGTVACWGGIAYNPGVFAPAGTFTQISAGVYSGHICGIRSNGTVFCTGENNWGQSMPPAGIFTQVSLGQFHTCGLKSDGTIACWGAGTINTGTYPDPGSYPEFGQSMPPAGIFTEVSAGGLFTCGLKSDGRVACWGQNIYGETTPPDLGARVGTFKVWMGLANSDDVGTRADLRVTMSVNGTAVVSGELDNVTTGSSGFANAVLQIIPLSLLGGPVDAPANAELKIEVSVRRTCSGGGHASGTLRLWYNGQPIDRSGFRDAGSRFDATISSDTKEYFLAGGFTLSPTSGSSRLFIDKFVNSGAPCPSRAFTPFGSWKMILP